MELESLFLPRCPGRRTSALNFASVQISNVKPEHTTVMSVIYHDKLDEHYRAGINKFFDENFY